MSRNQLNIIFMGTPDFARHTLDALINSNHNVIAVYSQPPRPKGRGHKEQKSPVHQTAEDNGIPVFTPKSLKSEEEQQKLSDLNADIAIVAAYGLLLPKAVLDAPKLGCLNIHASLLPRWRGASPIQHAIWKGDKKTGITIMQMDEGLDTGDMILKGEIKLTDKTTAPELHDDLADMGAALTLKVLNNIAQNGKAAAEPQDNQNSTYAPLLKKSDGHVNWNDTAPKIDAQIRALNPWPGVWAEIQGKRFKILKAETTQATTPETLDKNGVMPCGSGTALKLITLQPEGKKAMDFASAINGGYIKVTP